METTHPEAAAELRLPLRLYGVDHTARPTWKLAETVHFYRDVLSLPLIHTISARGWGPETHPDFLHFFFDSGLGSTIAFFHYLGEAEPDWMESRPGVKPWPEDHVFDANHTAWLVDDVETLHAWRDRLVAADIEVSVETAHEVIESIYFRDPNGYFIEITRKLRALEQLDSSDAALTLEAAVEASRAAEATGGLVSIDAIWSRKARTLSAARGEPLSPVTIFVPDLPEFACLAEAASSMPACTVTAVKGGYRRIDAAEEITFDRRSLGLRPALWYGLFTGGVFGTIDYGRDQLTISPATLS
jgi:catechol 2,3-dioxygenase-like lactoylglutathione lyase family enzyme